MYKKETDVCRMTEPETVRWQSFAAILRCVFRSCHSEGQAFERELEPDTALIFSSAERLVNERQQKHWVNS